MRSTTVEELEQRLQEDYDPTTSALSGHLAAGQPLKEMHITPMNPKANPLLFPLPQSHSRLLAHLMALMVSAIWATTFVCSKGSLPITARRR